jgi:hypothetical protein
MNDRRQNNITQFIKRNVEMTTTNNFFKLQGVSNREKTKGENLNH